MLILRREDLKNAVWFNIRKLTTVHDARALRFSPPTLDLRNFHVH